MSHSTIADLDSTKDQWAIQARVCRLWEATDFKKNNEVFALEMVFVDDQGDSIQGYVRKNHIIRFKDLLKEGEVYLFRHFKVAKASVQYRVVPNAHRIYFNVTTSVHAVTSAVGQIPRHAFYFVPKDGLEDKVGDNTNLTDIIGCVIAVGATRTGATGPLKEVDLESNTHGVMRVTLWGSATTLFDLSPYEADKYPVIVTVTSTTIRKFKRELAFASTTATKLYFNLDRPEVKSLAERFTPEYKGVKLLEGECTAQLPIAEQAALNRTTIARLLAMEWVSANQTIFCTLVGEIIEVDPRYGWCYVSCGSCSKKVVRNSGSFFCPHCNKSCPYPLIRYKLHVRAKDTTGSTTLVIFNDDAEKLIKAPSNTFAERVSMGDRSVPPEIGSLIGKTFVFKIKVTDYNLKDGLENYTVTKVFEDVGPAQKRKVENEASTAHSVGSGATANVSSSGEASLGPITPEKRPLDLKKMKVGE